MEDICYNASSGDTEERDYYIFDFSFDYAEETGPSMVYTYYTVPLPSNKQFIVMKVSQSLPSQFIRVNWINSLSKINTVVTRLDKFLVSCQVPPFSKIIKFLVIQYITSIEWFFPIKMVTNKRLDFSILSPPLKWLFATLFPCLFHITVAVKH